MRGRWRSHSRSGANQWGPYIAARAAESRVPALARYYGAGLPSADTPIGEVSFLALDIETTGLDEARHAIVSVGVVPFDLDRIRLADRHYWVVHPPRALSSLSVTFHHITHTDIENAPDFVEVLPSLLEAMAGRVVVVHYRNIERSFLDAAAKARVGEHLLFPVVDTMAIEAHRHRLSLWARFRRWLGHPPVSIRLNDSRQRYGLPVYQGHHALVDALATAELFQAQVATHLRRDMPVGRLWS
ncbi:3'-5' exonuclease [Arhodomonas aquaeolei]|uniref:3'-5' exonuclease n=1 Tax=Arhodomonas aquaeolei TaxID=2369 RepID=UPI0021672D3B|nr:3'-5' exonuclease [Arhodomonas aquaeolei]MCS4504431.1 3'-5' exonuclease [Arhodomonas aquaeolei]